MRWTDSHVDIANVVLRNREGDGYNFQRCRTELPNVSPSEISKVAKALKENNWTIPQAKESPPGQIRSTTRIELERPAPTVIFIRGKKIELEEEALRNAHFLWEEIEAKANYGGTFSEAIEDGVAGIYKDLVLEAPKAPVEA